KMIVAGPATAVVGAERYRSTGSPAFQVRTWSWAAATARTRGRPASAPRSATRIRRSTWRRAGWGRGRGDRRSVDRAGDPFRGVTGGGGPVRRGRARRTGPGST